MDGYSLTEVLLLLLAAGLVGFAKTSIGGVASISVAIFAAVMPARESTGALLPLLMLGDVFAVSAYRTHARWPVLLRLVPAVLVGIVAGTWFVSRVDDLVMRRTIGAVLVALVAVNLWTRLRQRPSASAVVRQPAPGTAVGGGAVDGAVGGVGDGAVDGAVGGAGDGAVDGASGGVGDGASDGAGDGAVGGTPLRRRVAAGFYGSLTGFTTMVANAGGPVMSLYMLSVRMPMLAFLGTAAWLFALFNVVKVPFMVGLGLLTWHSLTLDALLAPALLVGAVVGRRVIRHLDQQRFERIVLVVTVVSALNLVR